MLVWRLCRERYAGEAFSGHGARLYGGRWNSAGTPMVYASSSLALAAIELFVHLEPNQQPADLVSIAAELPAGEPAQRLAP
ncbi:MAG: RES family NAD+ phosphorylase, partial [Terracidiphilus sp.]